MTLQQVFLINKDLNMSKERIENEILKGYEQYCGEIQRIKSNLRLRLNSEHMNRMNDNYNEFNTGPYDNNIIYNVPMNEIFIKIGTLGLFNEMLPEQKLWYDIIFDESISKIGIQCMTGIIIEPIAEEIVQHHFKRLEVL